jgi:hypothetical protein
MNRTPPDSVDLDRVSRAAARACTVALLLLGLVPRLTAATGTAHLAGNATWVDSGVDVKAGEVYRFQAKGEIQYPGAKEATPPQGSARGWRDLARAFPLNSADKGAVIGRVGALETAVPFLIGAGREVTMPVAGRLFLGINGPSGVEASGEFTVTFERAGSAPKASRSFKLAAVPASYFDTIPRRVSDPRGNPGDRVNFAIVGDEARLKEALAGAGWVAVDKDVKSTLVRGALATLSKQVYLTLPMSPLQLFGRTQDYGFAHAEPLQVAAQRHHFRVWRAPSQIDGQTLWIGAGTHDVGFDRDQRNNGLTHKIDPDTDKERDYIAATLQQSGAAAKVGYVTPKDTVLKAKTAHGEEFFTDGRVAIIWLRP